MASIWTTRTRFLLVVAGLLLAVNLGRQGYRWFAHADERVELRRLGDELEDAALAVVRTQLLADSLRGAIEQADDSLRIERAGIRRIERRAEAFSLPPTLYDEYRRELSRYNRRVETRNARYEEWRTVVEDNHRSVDRYNGLADSMRSLGRQMGEPYLAIPSPAEVALRHGLRDPRAPAETGSVMPE